MPARDDAARVRAEGLANVGYARARRRFAIGRGGARSARGGVQTARAVPEGVFAQRSQQRDEQPLAYRVVADEGVFAPFGRERLQRRHAPRERAGRVRDVQRRSDAPIFDCRRHHVRKPFVYPVGVPRPVVVRHFVRDYVRGESGGETAVVRVVFRANGYVSPEVRPVRERAGDCVFVQQPNVARGQRLAHQILRLADGVFEQVHAAPGARTRADYGKVNFAGERQIHRSPLDRNRVRVEQRTDQLRRPLDRLEQRGHYRRFAVGYAVVQHRARKDVRESVFGEVGYVRQRIQRRLVRRFQGLEEGHVRHPRRRAPVRLGDERQAADGFRVAVRYAVDNPRQADNTLDGGGASTGYEAKSVDNARLCVGYAVGDPRQGERRARRLRAVRSEIGEPVQRRALGVRYAVRHPRHA